MELLLNIHYPASTTQENNLLKEVSKALFFYTPEQAGRVTKRVLHTLRKFLTVNESADLISRVPEYLRVMYVINWQRKEQPIACRHLDEFTESVLHDDYDSEQPAFHKEVDALTAVITILKFLNQQAGLLSFPSFGYHFRLEMEQTMLETAA